MTTTDIFNIFFDPDNDSDTEVPYADIMITVRGVSTPELTQVGYLTPGDQKEVRDKTWQWQPVCHFYLTDSQIHRTAYSPLFYKQLFATVDHVNESKLSKCVCYDYL